MKTVTFFTKKFFAFLILPTLFCLDTLAFLSAPGGPGAQFSWPPANKQAVGTTLNGIPLWFTVAEGIVTEVFYPSIDRPQMGDLQFIVANQSGFFSEQKRDTFYTVQTQLPEGSTLIKGKDKSGKYAFEQIIFVDPLRPVLKSKVTLYFYDPSLKVYLLLNPNLGGTGSDNRGWIDDRGLSVIRSNNNGPALSFKTSAQITASSMGYVGRSDGWGDLKQNHKLTQTWDFAGPGNIAYMAELSSDSQGIEFEYALSFEKNLTLASKNADDSLADSFFTSLQNYQTQWTRYINSLEPWVKQDPWAIQSALVLKMHEDKNQRGAVVASLSTPGIPEGYRASSKNIGGYHLIWPRDLYHAAMGFLALGDTNTVLNIWKYLKNTQNPDGSWYQNFWVNGAPYWTGQQLDETAFPILLALQLAKRKLITLDSNDLKTIDLAAQYLLQNGPITQQERWEEMNGYSPSTLAAEIAGLRAAFLLTSRSSYDLAAKDWNSKLADWTFVNKGPLGDHYFLRSSPFGRPNQSERVVIANGGGWAYSNELIDGGFLELVRLGVRSPLDSFITDTLSIYTDPGSGVAQWQSNGGLTFKRYNRDAYGPGAQAGTWPLLSGEMGMYLVHAQSFEKAQVEYQNLLQGSEQNYLIPEQTPSQGVACPLVWAHAEQLVLLKSLILKGPVDAP